MPGFSARRIPFTTLVAALFAVAGVQPGGVHAQESRASQTDINFNIPAQDVATALEAFGRQSGKSIMFDREKVGHVTLKPVIGRYTPEQALRQLIDGTGLAIRSANRDTFVIEPQEMTQTRTGHSELRLAQAQADSGSNGRPREIGRAHV